jgi:hypothetical protein
MSNTNVVSALALDPRQARTDKVPERRLRF